MLGVWEHRIPSPGLRPGNNRQTPVHLHFCARNVGTSRSCPSTMVGSLFSKRPRVTGSNCRTSCFSKGAFGGTGAGMSSGAGCCWRAATFGGRVIAGLGRGTGFGTGAHRLCLGGNGSSEARPNAAALPWPPPRSARSRIPCGGLLLHLNCFGLPAARTAEYCRSSSADCCAGFRLPRPFPFPRAAVESPARVRRGPTRARARRRFAGSTCTGAAAATSPPTLLMIVTLMRLAIVRSTLTPGNESAPRRRCAC